MTSGKFWNYFRNEMNDVANENNSDNYKKINKKTTTSRSLDYKTKKIGNTPDNNSRLDTGVVVLLKHLSTFWRSLDLFFIN